MEKTLIIFDIDGTLLDSNRVDSRCFAETYESIYQRTFPTIDWRQYPAVSDTTIFSTVIKNHFNRPVDPEEVVVFQDAFVSRIQQKRVEQPESFREVPGARNTLDQLLVMEDIALGIGTGGWKAPAMVKLNHMSMPIRQMSMAFADGHPTREAILQECIDKARDAHDYIKRIVYIGDAIWDVTTTRNMGLPFVGIRHRGDIEALEKHGAINVLQDFTNFDQFFSAVHEARVPLHLS